MSDLTELYQELVLDHNSRPRNFRRIVDANRSAEGFNPLCGDRVTVYVQVQDGVVKDVSFQGTGCAISRASASMMTESVKGKTIEESKELFEKFHHQVTGSVSGRDDEDLGDLEAFSGIREYPSRVKCAVLGWHTLKAAIENRDRKVSSE
ncbi:MAG: uncharacterized protein HW397_171 [Dehalococcoidia bacterium]|nr:uncharacterized protein [Dehalococcoidia bacterium]